MTPEELEFTYKVRQHLQCGLDDIDALTSEKLAQFKSQALASVKNQKSERIALPQFAFFNASESSLGSGWKEKLSIFLPLLFLILGLVTLESLTQVNHIQNIADIDTAVLTDDLPLDAYLDRGFEQFVLHEAE